MQKTTTQELHTRFHTRRAHIGVIGLGYVGLPLAVTFAQAGYQVTGIDVDATKIESINRGNSYIEDIPSSVLAPLLRRPATSELQTLADGVPSTATDISQAPPAAHATHHGNNGRIGQQATTGGTLWATTDFSALADCDGVSICVPTPLRKTGDPDISYIIAVTEQLARYLHPGMVIVLESTTYPGTTREILLEQLERAASAWATEQTEETPHPRVGRDYFLAFSPERVDPGRTDWTTVNTPKVLGGITPACLEMATVFYGQAIETIVPVSSPEAAEMVKLFENTFRAVNIGLANELLLMCDKLGLDAWEVLDAAATKPFGFMKFTPGPGLGGHCIPIDPLYLSWKLRTLQYNARFIELASEVNTGMPRYWVQRVQDALNEAGKSVKGSQILVLGAAYKKNVSDLRESPALDIIHLLQEKGAQVAYHDPHVPSFHIDGMAMDIGGGSRPRACNRRTVW